VMAAQRVSARLQDASGLRILWMLIMAGALFDTKDNKCLNITYMKVLRDIQFKNHVPVQRPLRLYNTNIGWIVQDKSNFLLLGRTATEITDTCVFNEIHYYLITQ